MCGTLIKRQVAMFSSFQPALSSQKHDMCEQLTRQCDLMLGTEDMVLKRITHGLPLQQRCKTVKLLCKSLTIYES